MKETHTKSHLPQEMEIGGERGGQPKLQGQGKRWMRQILLWALVLLTHIIQAQSPLHLKAKAAYQVGDYPTALPLLQKALDRSGDFALCEPLAICHMRTGDPRTAAALWELAVAAGKCSDTAALYMAVTALQLGDYNQARAKLADVPMDRQSHRLFDSLTTCLVVATALADDSLKYRVVQVSIPEWQLAMCPQWYQDGLLLTGGKQAGNGRLPDLQVGHAQRINLFSFEAPKPFTPMRKEGYRDGPAVVAPSQRRVFFTRTFDKYPDPVNRMTKGGLSRILMVEKKSGQWSPTTELNLNSWQFSNAHPTLARNDSVMVFASNRPGGRGGADLYLVQMGLGGWEVPFNLGTAINTPGNEFFPTLVGEDTLYFASDGHRGLGGLDIFLTWRAHGQWQPPINLGYPVNSHKDDFGLHLMRDQAIAYLSSNRGVSGQEVVYAALYAIRAEVQVVDADTKLPLPGATIRKIDRGGRVRNYTTNADGMALVDLEMSAGAYLELEAQDYLGTHATISNLNSLPGLPPLHVIPLRRAFVAKVKGRVTQSPDGIALGGAQVQATYVHDSLSRHVWTRPDGEYEIDLPAFGKVFLRFEKEGMRTQITELELSSGVANQVHVVDARLQMGRTQLVDVVVFDLQGLPLREVEVAVLGGAQGREMARARTNAFGNAVLALEWEDQHTHYLSAKSDGFLPQQVALKQEFTPSAKHVRIDLIAEAEDQLSKTLYYALNQTHVPSLTNEELQGLGDFLRTSSDYRIEVRSYTDAIGRSRYNLRLSIRRANALRRYISRAAGIALARINAKGFGERELVNECDDQHPCEEARHAQNRRSEIWLLSR